MDTDDTRLMNHSCEPNTMDYPLNDPTMIVASKNIEKNEEVTWNYLPFMNLIKSLSVIVGVSIVSKL